MDDATLDRLLDGERWDGGEDAVARLVALVGSASPSGLGSAPPALTRQDLEAVGFRTLGLLGSGVHATVWDAQDATLGRRVALKVVRSQGTDLSAQRTFLREARMLARVDHPNVVRLWSAERSDDGLVLALERIEGRTLREIVMRDGPLDARAAARIVLDVARGLAAVHAAGVLHRDLHPGNVMRRSDGSAVLLDFSLARGDGAERLRSGGTLGTPAYEAPEVLQGGEPTERSDVYALGMLLVWLSSGRTPLRGASWRELRASAVAGHRAPLAEIAPGMPRELRAVVERAIQVDPARRTIDARAFARELQAALGLKRRRVALALGLVLAVGGTGGVLELVRRVRSSSQAEGATTQKEIQWEREKSMQELSRLDRPRVQPSGLGELAGAAPWDPGRHGFDRPPLVVPDQYARIQDALHAAVAGDVVGLREGKYDQTLEIANLSVAIVSLDGPGKAVLNGEGIDGPVVWLHTSESKAEHDVLLWGLSITGGNGRELSPHTGRALYGGGVLVQGANLRVRLESCELWGNGYDGTTHGGGLAVRNSLDGRGGVTLVDCLIVRNAACDGGAILADKARIKLERCIVADNLAGIFGCMHGGIALANDSELEVIDSTLWGNRGKPFGWHRHARPSPEPIVMGSLVQVSEAQMLSEPSPFLDAASGDYRQFDPVRERRGPPHPAWALCIGASPRGVGLLGANSEGGVLDHAEPLRVQAPFSTIKEVIENAPEGAVVLIGPGVYYDQLVLGERSLTLVGEFGASATVIDVSNVDGPAVVVHGPDTEGSQPSKVVIRGLTVRGGNGLLGGAMAAGGRVDLDLQGVVLWESGVKANTSGGAGLWAGADANVAIRDCLFARNHAFGNGAALYVDDRASASLEHCTMIGADGVSKPLIHVAPLGRLDVKKSLLWGPKGAVVFDPECRGHAGIDVSQSLIRGGWDGPGVLDVDPDFVDAANADWRRAASAAVGAGWGYRSAP